MHLNKSFLGMIMLIYHLIASYIYTRVFRFFYKKGLLIHLLVVAPQDLLYLTASIDSVTYSHAMQPLLQKHLPPSLGVCAYPSELNNCDAQLRIGPGRLCRHNFQHNRHLKISGIMPAYQAEFLVWQRILPPKLTSHRKISKYSYRTITLESISIQLLVTCMPKPE